MATVQDITTAEQLLGAPGLGRCELVRGELVMMSPAGFEHGDVAGRVHGHLFHFVTQNRLGTVTAAETGFQIGHDPDTVRAPDVGFIRTERVPKVRTRGFFQGPPDLAVEVISPTDRAGELLAKVQDWLAAGCRAVWVVDPTSRTISVYRGSGEISLLGITDEVADEELLPGFRLSVAEVF
jgi:Uma2 family endonuclease